MLLKNKIAVVTGASNGIGRAITNTFLRNGARVIGLDLEEGEDRNPELIPLKADVSSTAECERVWQEISRITDHIDILVNCAGITRDALTKKMTEEQFDQVIAVNLRGTFRMMKAVARPMMRKRYGRIINLSSIVGEMGNAGQVNYAASKAGVNGMTKAFAKEIAGKGITVNAVAPGFIDTDMTRALSREAAESLKARIPMGRLGTPEDVAHVISFLASEEAGYVTGQVIGVNGGML